jgi:predicted nucleic acid-binding protein
LWDIDACGHQAYTVHSGFNSTPDKALTVWQAGVGEIAAWMRGRDADRQELPEDLDELVAELADSCCVSTISMRCSQRVLRTGSLCACCTCAATTSTNSPINWWLCMIAAIASARGLPLYTRNAAGFKGLDDMLTVIAI